LGWIAGDVIATDPALHPKLQALFAGWSGASLDALLAWLGITTRTIGAAGAEIAFGVLGVIVVLVAGSIWRRRKLQRGSHAAS
jgi:hypothetical protein